MGALPDLGATVADRFRLERKLAAAGMGTVFAARDLHTGGEVALKVLHPQLARDPEIHRRFRREASILRALEHPAVVAVHSVGTDATGLPFTAMELLRGETLHARIARGPLAPEELRPILGDICAGLAAAHAHGVIHGDLKPANVFLLAPDAAGVRVKVVDFGLSKVLGLERLTRTGEVLGTPAYMSPELLTGDAEIDPRVDVYALGVVLYQALTGRLPFEERNPGRLLMQIVAGGAPPPSRVRPGLAAAVDRVVMRAMAPRRQDRFAEVGELAVAFDAAGR